MPDDEQVTFGEQPERELAPPDSNLRSVSMEGFAGACVPVSRRALMPEK